MPQADIGLPGGGSDYAAFTSIAGVPSIGFGFSADSGVYHSAYDTIDFMERIGDPGYRQHQSTAALATWLLWRLGNDRTVAFDYRRLAQDVVTGLSAVRRELKDPGLDNGVPGLSRAWSAAGNLAVAAGKLHAQLGSADAMKANPAALRVANQHMYRAHRQLTQAPCADSWSRSILIAPDPQDTYQSLFMPGVVSALRRADIGATVVGLTDLAAALERVAVELTAAAPGTS
jgi:N-acetylated-alpha-linked acidic dipeptidase